MAAGNSNREKLRFWVDPIDAFLMIAECTVTLPGGDQGPMKISNAIKASANVAAGDGRYNPDDRRTFDEPRRVSC